MLTFERVHPTPENWASTLQQFPDRTLYQSPPWLSFLEETQKGEIVIAALREGNAVLGYFAGLMIRRFGLRILGSPLPGWTTSYMGFVLEPKVSRTDALEALRHFAFRDLRCRHLELMDRNLDVGAIKDRYAFTRYNGFEIDLNLAENDVFSNFSYECRHCIRKAVRSGVVIQEANDAGFVDDYYGQLTDVFAKQCLIPTYSRERVTALLRHLQTTGNLLLLRAIDADGHCIATMITLAMHDRAEVWGGASWRAYQHLRPNELLVWHTCRYWKSRSIQSLDLGGAGDYKRRYGGHEIAVPWIRTSRYPVLPLLRNSAALLQATRQRWRGAWQSRATSLCQLASPSRTYSKVRLLQHQPLTAVTYC
jgi:CelD/BcsL family acetyltransferase involved in cellulose biosynthesis